MVPEVAHVLYKAYAHNYTEIGQNIEVKTVSKCKASEMIAHCIVFAIINFAASPFSCSLKGHSSKSAYPETGTYP